MNKLHNFPLVFTAYYCHKCVSGVELFQWLLMFLSNWSKGPAVCTGIVFFFSWSWTYVMLGSRRRKMQTCVFSTNWRVVLFKIQVKNHSVFLLQRKYKQKPSIAEGKHQILLLISDWHFVFTSFILLLNVILSDNKRFGGL